MIEAEVEYAAPTIVLNEFNHIDLLIAHAQHGEQQPPAPGEDNDDEDNGYRYGTVLTTTTVL